MDELIFIVLKKYYNAAFVDISIQDHTEGKSKLNLT